MNAKICYQLREHLDTIPAGFPETESGAEIKILKKFFTPTQKKPVQKLQECEKANPVTLDTN
jgi:hypothetical protein